MAFCRSRLYFESQRSPETAVIQTLDFNDDSDIDMSFQNSSMDLLMSPSPCGKRDSTDSQLWDSGMGSPTPIDSPRLRRRSPSKLSPIPINLDESEEDSSPIPPCPPSPFKPQTPPHKKLRKLRLYDTPHTPKTLLQKAQRRTTRANRRRFIGENQEQTKTTLDPEKPQANVNPFTAGGWSAGGVKRARPVDRCLVEESCEETDEESAHQKKIALHDINTSRYNEEFHQISKLGDGEFGSVYQCVHRLDGCTYAIKKSKTPVAGSMYERNAMNEVYAHAVLGRHPHMVRYYSAWAENDHMYIQNEYCNGGSLADVIQQNKDAGGVMCEDDLKQVLLHVADGLKNIHSQGLVHLDIKPGNIFIHRAPVGQESGVEEDLCEDQMDSPHVTYKIGDLGHVTSVNNPLVEEGDCRYLPQEILQENFGHLPKADIFALALTILAAGSGADLPKNGDDWHTIRRGQIPRLPQCSEEFNMLLKTMVHQDPRARPSAATLTQHPVLCPFAKKSKAQLRKELNAEKFKNEVLSRQLQKATQNTEECGPPTKMKKSSRLVGRKVNRSMSLQCF